MNEHSTNTKSDADVTEDDAPPVASQLKPHPIFSELAATPGIVLDTKENSTDSYEPKSTEATAVVSVTQMNTEKSVSNIDDADANTNFIESNVDPPTTAISASPSQTNGDSGEVTAETYGFLEESLEPELMAELYASGEQHKHREQTLGELLNTQPLS